MPKIPCRVESGRREEGGGCKRVCGGREGTFSSGKKSPPFPRPPFPPPKTAHRANRIMEGASGKKGLDDTTGRDGKNVALSPSGCLPQELSVPPLLRRAPHSTGDQHGAWGCRGCAGPDPLPLRRACPARMPGNGRHPTAIPQSASGSIPRQRPPKKRQRGRSSRRRPAPLQNRAQHGQPTLPSAAGVMTAKRRRTTGPRRRTWAWRTGCCPHGPGCRHGRAAGCWSPSHAPRA